MTGPTDNTHHCLLNIVKPGDGGRLVSNLRPQYYHRNRTCNAVLHRLCLNLRVNIPSFAQFVAPWLCCRKSFYINRVTRCANPIQHSGISTSATLLAGASGPIGGTTLHLRHSAGVQQFTKRFRYAMYIGKTEWHFSERKNARVENAKRSVELSLSKKMNGYSVDLL